MRKGHKTLPAIAVVAATLMVAGCSDKDSVSNMDWGGLGYFYDSAVGGLHYECTVQAGRRSGAVDPEEPDQPQTYEGFSSRTGAFTFCDGTPTRFFIENNGVRLDLGEVTLWTADDEGTIVTPIELAGATRSNYRENRQVINTLRLLQTLDADGDPSNGIDLSPFSVQTRFNRERVRDAFEQVRIDVPAGVFEQQLQEYLDVINEVWNEEKDAFELDEERYIPAEPVTEEAAIEHFEETLKGSGLKRADLVGVWELRSGDWGDFSSRLELKANGSGEGVEYGGNCGSGPDAFLTNERVAKRLCPRKETHQVNWSFSDGEIRLEARDFTDTCRIVTGNMTAFRAACRVFTGSGYETEAIIFIRQSDRFSSSAMRNDVEYTSYNAGQQHSLEELSTLRFRSNGSGHYRNNDEGKVDFDWRFASQGSQLHLETASENLVAGFRRYIAGALEVLEEGDRTLWVPKPSHVSYLDNSRIGGVCYDLISGDRLDPCQLLRPFPESHSSNFEVLMEAENTDLICRQIYFMDTDQEALRFHWFGCSPRFGNGFRYIMLRVGNKERS